MPHFLSLCNKVHPLQPLFTTGKGDAMTKPCFSSRLHIFCHLCGLNPALYTSHSFRIRVASKVPTSILKALVFISIQCYVRPEIKDIILTQKAMRLIKKNTHTHTFAVADRNEGLATLPSCANKGRSPLRCYSIVATCH